MLFVHQTEIVDYGTVARNYIEKMVFGELAVDIQRKGNQVEVIAHGKNKSRCGPVPDCNLIGLTRRAGFTLAHPAFSRRILQSQDGCSAIAQPFYLSCARPGFSHFSASIFTRMIGSGVECGLNAFFALGQRPIKKQISTCVIYRKHLPCLAWSGFRAVTTKYWRTGLSEYHRLLKPAFVKAIFNIRIRFNIIHVCNAPSPAATASLAIGKTISENVLSFLN